MRRTSSSWLSTIAKLGLKQNYRRSNGLRRGAMGAYSRRLVIEPLEDRRLLATLTVSNLGDDIVNSSGDAPGTLRQAIFDANATDTIEFDSSLFENGPSRILLTEGQLLIAKSITITGPGADLLTIDVSGSDLSPNSLPFDSSTYGSGNDGDGSRVFNIDNSNSSVIDVNISLLTLTGGDIETSFGNKGNGGAIRSLENLTLDSVYIVDNMAFTWVSTTNFQALGGGIYQEGGSLTVKNSTIAQNTAHTSYNSFNLLDGKDNYLDSARGGGIYVKDANVSIFNSTISHNQARFEGGGLYITGSGTAELTNVTVYGNRLTADPHLSESPAYSGTLPGGFVNAGGGIAVHSTGPGTVKLHNTLVAGNVKTIDTSLDWPNGMGGNHTKIARTADDISGSFDTTSSYNLVGFDETIGNGIEKYNPNDGTTLNDTDNHNIVGGEGVGADGLPSPGINAKVYDNSRGGKLPTIGLLPGSPAIDAGSDTIASALTKDQRGFARKMDQLGVGGSNTVDIGAHEAGLIVTSLADDGGGDDLTLREALTAAQSLTERGEITFDPSLFDIHTEELTLASELSVASNVSIVGPGSGLLTIDANENSRVFNVGGGKNATIQGLTMRGGKVTGTNYGGGILNAGNLTLDSVVVTDNESAGQGGGIYNSNPGTLHIINSTVSDNVAAHGGGIKSKSSSKNAVVIENSAIINNEALTYGGIYISGDAGAGTRTAKIVSTTFSRNEATASDGIGGGIAVNGGFTLAIINGTITDNEAGSGSGVGGGIWNSGSTVTLHNTILAENTASHVYHADHSGSSLHSSSSYNIIGSNGNTGLVNNSNGNHVGAWNGTLFDPGLAALGDNGGATLTHALEKGSAGINAGSDSYVTTGLSTDQRGYSRKVYQTSNSTPLDVGYDPDDPGTVTNEKVDIGAYELGLVVTTWGDDESYLEDSAFNSSLSLREALYAAEEILPGADHISFDPIFDVPRTITLGVDEDGEEIYSSAYQLMHQSDLNIDSNVQIDGPGAQLLTIDAASQEKIDEYAGGQEDDFRGIRVFYVSDQDVRNEIDPLIQTHDEDPTNPHFEWITATINDLTITGGRLESDLPGGGVYNGGALTLDSVIIRDNYASLWGGGIFSTGDLILKNSIVDSNKATGQFGSYSGGISARGYVEAVAPTTADNEQLNLIRPGSLTILNSQVTRNASTHAGAMDAEDGAQFVRIHNSTFAENYSVKVFDEEEEFRSGVGSLQIRGFDYGDDEFHINETITESRDLILGGLELSVHGRVQALITNTTISNNYSVSEVGGLNVTGLVDATIVSSTIAFNRSLSGGNGIDARFRQSSPALYGDTTVTLHNTIVAHNVSYTEDSTDIEERNLRGKFETNSSHNLISFDPDSTNGINDGSGNIVGESEEILAGLAPLGDYGGPLLPDGTHLLTHALAIGSRAIDAGDDSKVTAYNLSSDQRGGSRITDGDNDSFAAVDIGTYELQTPEDAIVLVTTKVDESDSFNPNDQNTFDYLSLREAVEVIKSPAVTTSNKIRFSPYFYDDQAEEWQNLMQLASVTTEDQETSPNPSGKFESDTKIHIPEQVFGLTDGQIMLDIGNYNTGFEIAGWRADQLSISGNVQSRVFEVAANVTAEFRDLRIKGGYAVGGAGILSFGALEIDRSQIDGNTATSAGGGINAATGTLTVRNSTVANNSSGNVGGGIIASGALSSPALIVNSTISTNSAGISGGGMRDLSGAQIINCTITANTATTGSGGGISGVGTELHNSIVAKNFAPAYPESRDIWGTFDGNSSYNLIGYDDVSGNGIDDDLGSGNHNMVGESGAGIDPQLSALGYWGGPTMTHRLLSDSLAIDAGDNSVALTYDLDEDQRGIDRIVDWDNDDIDDMVDIGAVELAFDEIYS